MQNIHSRCSLPGALCFSSSVFICVHLWIPSPDVLSENKFARIAALRPVRRRDADAPLRAEPPAAGDRLAEMLGAGVNRNHYGEHLSLRQWYATPEMCSPDARSLALLLPCATDGE